MAIAEKKEGTVFGKKINVHLSESEKGRWRKVTKTLSTVTCNKCGLCSFYKKGFCLNTAETVRSGNTCKFGNIYTTTFEHLSSSRSHALLKVCEKDSVYNALSYPDDWYIEIVDDILFLDLRFAMCDKHTYLSGHLVETEDYHIRIPESILGWYSVIPVKDFTTELLHEIVEFGSQLSDTVANEYNGKVVPEILAGVKRILPEVYKAYVTKYIQDFLIQRMI